MPTLPINLTRMNVTPSAPNRSTTQRKLVFSTQNYQYLCELICKAGKYQKGEIERRAFPDGERYQRIHTLVSGRDVVLIGGTTSDSDTLELYDAACSLVAFGANSFDLVIPYFSYSTMERAAKLGEVVTAKSRARLLSSIPEAARGNRVLLLDLHSEGIPYYFEGWLRPVHLSGKKVVARIAKRLGGRNFVLASTDAGRAKWVESLAGLLRVDPSFVYKRRIDASHTQITAVSAHVMGRNVVIYDDMIRTGGSLINAARAYREAGARDISVITTHGLFCNEALNRLKESKLIKKIVSLDSHPAALAAKSKFLEVVSCAPIFVEELNRPH